MSYYKVTVIMTVQYLLQGQKIDEDVEVSYITVGIIN